MNGKHIYGKPLNAIGLRGHNFTFSAFFDVIGIGHSAEGFVF